MLVQVAGPELLDRTLIYNQRHLLHALRGYEQVHNWRYRSQGVPCRVRRPEARQCRRRRSGTECWPSSATAWHPPASHDQVPVQMPNIFDASHVRADRDESSGGRLSRRTGVPTIRWQTHRRWLHLASQMTRIRLDRRG